MGNGNTSPGGIPIFGIHPSTRPIAPVKQKHVPYEELQLHVVYQNSQGKRFRISSLSSNKTPQCNVLFQDETGSYSIEGRVSTLSVYPYIPENSTPLSSKVPNSVRGILG